MLSNISGLLSIKVKKEFRKIKKYNKTNRCPLSPHTTLYICEKRYRFKITPYTEQLNPRKFFPIFECIRYLNRTKRILFNFGTTVVLWRTENSCPSKFSFFFNSSFYIWLMHPSQLFIHFRTSSSDIEIEWADIRDFFKVESDFFFQFISSRLFANIDKGEHGRS